MRRSGLVLFSVGFLGILALLVWWQLSRQPPGAAFLTLPTGEIVRFRGVTVGTNHVEPGFLPFQKHLPQPVVDAVGRMFGRAAGSPMVVLSAEPRLVVWLEVRTPPGVPPGAIPYKSLWLTEADGGKPRRELRGIERTTFLNPGQRTTPVEFGVFPRRAGMLGLVVGDQPPGKGWAMNGSLIFRNPARSVVGRWAGESLPQVKVEQGLECALMSFAVTAAVPRGEVVVHGGGATPAVRPARDWDMGRGVAEFRFRTTDGTSNRWNFGGLELADASGNVCRPGSSSLSGWWNGAQSVRFDWSPVLWDGVAWELRVHAKRGAGAEWGPEESAIFDAVPMPEGEGTNRVGRTVESQGVKVRLLEVVRKPAVDRAAGWSSSDLSRISVVIAGLTNGVFADLVRVTDEAGRAYTPDRFSTSSGSAAGEVEASYSFVEFGATARSVRIEIAVQRSRVFAFRLEPKGREVLGQPLGR